MESFNQYIRTSEFKDLLKRYEQALKDNDSAFFDADDLLDIAEYYNIKNEYDKANAAACYCLELYPDFTKAKVFIARCAIVSGDINLAQRIADEITYDDDLDVAYLRAELMLINSETDKAETYLRNYFNNLEEGSDERYDMALDVPLIYCDYSNWHLADEWINMPEAQAQKDVLDYAEAMASICTNTGRYAEAIPLWNRILDEDSFFAHAWVQLAMCQCQTGLCHEALQSVQYAIAIDPDYPDAYLTAGNAYYSIGKHKEAKEMYGHLLELLPGDAQGELLMATLLFSEENNDEAMLHIENAIATINEITDREVPRPIYIDIYRHAAFISCARGNIKEAQKYLDELSKHGCSKNEIMLLRASVYLEGGMQDEAFDIFRTILSEDPCETDICLQIGCILVDSRYFELGRNILLATITMIQQDGTICKQGWDRLAYAALMTDHYEEFIIYLQEAVKYLPIETMTIFSPYFPEDMPISDYPKYAKKNKIKGI